MWHPASSAIYLPRMRRTIFVALAGLLFAFTFFYVFAWPSTMSSRSKLSDTIGFDKVVPGELLYAGLGPFSIVGRRDMTVVTVKLNDPSVGIELLETRVDLFAGGVGLGVARGTDPLSAGIERLPRAPNYVLRSADEGGFYVAFKVLSRGTFRFRGIEVTYQTGWLTRSVVLGPTVTVTARS